MLVVAKALKASHVPDLAMATAAANTPTAEVPMPTAEKAARPASERAGNFNKALLNRQ